MRFREHRGMLADSLETVVTLTTRAQLIEHIEGLYAPYLHGYDFKRISIRPYFMAPDERCGWQQTYIVALPGFAVIGFTDELPMDAGTGENRL